MQQQKKSNTALAVTMTILIAILSFIGLGVWYNNTHYTQQYDTNFMSSCMSNGGNSSACACVLNNIKSSYSYSDAKKFEEQWVQTGVLPYQLQTAAENCISS